MDQRIFGMFELPNNVRQQELIHVFWFLKT